MKNCKFDELTKEQQADAISTYGDEATDPTVVFGVVGDTIIFMSKKSTL